MTRRDSDLEPALAHLTLMLLGMTEVAFDLVSYAGTSSASGAGAPRQPRDAGGVHRRLACTGAQVLWLVKHHRAARPKRRPAGPPVPDLDDDDREVSRHPAQRLPVRPGYTLAPVAARPAPASLGA